MKLIKIPAKNGLGKTEGTELAPDAIIEQLKQIHLNESGIKPEYSIQTVKVNPSNIEETNQNIFDHITQLDDRPIILGGDHSITYPAFRAFSKKFKNAGIVVFDAHPDLMHNFEPPTHEDYLRTLIEQGHLSPNNLILIGVRSWHPLEMQFLKQHKIKYFSMQELQTEGLQESTDAIMSVARTFGACYVSIDIDVLDPAFAPATGYPEPGGLTTRQFLYMLHRLKNLKNIQAYDLVEVNPLKDPSQITVQMAAKLVSEIF
ncbi:MAG: arginase family protein [Candidatus Woesearchaeota archaeon]